MATHKRYLRKGMLVVQICITQEQLKFLHDRSREAADRAGDTRQTGKVSAYIRDMIDLGIKRYRANQTSVEAKPFSEPHYDTIDVA